ncbi:hypothetical protein [Vibrio alfacsensis]|uniref:hypothetical protein n=1 Tax=Vibrio alfacsensis TaxID=1074311 RepID=UPI004067910D
MATLKGMELSDTCLLSAIVEEISERVFTTTTAFALKNGLNTAIEHLELLDIKNLLLEEPNNISVHYVIAGFKELERQIEQNTLSKKNSISSIFRSVVSDTGFLMNDGLSIGLCRFNTRFVKNRITPMPIEACSPSDIYAIKIKSTNSSCAYWTIDPDSLFGLIKPNGLLAIGLKKAQEESLIEPFDDYIVQTWLLTLQGIHDSEDKNEILYLLNHNPFELGPLDVLKGLTKFEYNLYQSGAKSSSLKSSLFRRLLAKGGNIGNFGDLNKYSFKTRFVKNSKNECFDFNDVERYLPIKTIKDDLVEFHFLKTSEHLGDGALSVTINNVLNASKSDPISHSVFSALKKMTGLIFSQHDIIIDNSFLWKETKSLEVTDLELGFDKIHSFICDSFNVNGSMEFNKFKNLILRQGEIESDIVDSYLAKEAEQKK